MVKFWIILMTNLLFLAQARPTFNGFFDNLEDQIYETAPEPKVTIEQPEEEMKIFFSPNLEKFLRHMPIQFIEDQVELVENKVDQFEKHLKTLNKVYKNRKKMNKSRVDILPVKLIRKLPKDKATAQPVTIQPEIKGLRQMQNDEPAPWNDRPIDNFVKNLGVY